MCILGCKLAFPIYSAPYNIAILDSKNALLATMVVFIALPLISKLI